MADLEALRATIEERRAELQSLKDERSAVQEEAADIQTEKILKAELANIETDIAREKDLLAAQKGVIDAMTAAVVEQDQDAVSDGAVVVTPEVTTSEDTVIAPPPSVPTIPLNEEESSVVDVESTDETESK